MISLLTYLFLLGTAFDHVRGAFPSLTSSLGPVVNLGYTAYAGNTTAPSGSSTSVTFFGGIRYAKPPTGNLRWRAPVSLDERVVNGGHAQMQDARNWGAPCIQQPAAVGIGSEDCLFLNVWKPTTAKEGDNLPVIVYIHGGGFYAGSTPQFPLYDWVAQDQGVIGVSIAYRLNLFGFLPGDPVKADGDLNAGLLDQRAALEWIQRHIVRFGGDPSKVTIAGESAGGAAVILQATAYGGTRPVPFQRAIAQSIGLYALSNPTEINTVFANVTTAAGCPSSGSEAIACLRQASVGALVSSINHVTNNYLAPVLDGTFMPDLPSNLITQGKFAKVDFIGGHCTNDGRNFAGSPSGVVDDASVVAAITRRYKNLSNSTIQAILELYPAPGTPGSPFATQYDRAWTIMQEIIMGCMDLHFANHTTVPNTYLYRFNTPNAVLFAANPYLGVMHTSDIYFLFDGTNSLPNAANTFKAFNTTELPVSQEIISYWTSFAKTGNPSTTKQSFSPEWSSLASGQRVVMTEDVRGSGASTASAMEPVPQAEIDRCAWWMGVANVETRV